MPRLTHGHAAATHPDGLPALSRAEHAAPRPRTLLRALTDTRGDALTLLVRVALGAILIPHGLQHLTGAWGGPGLGGTSAFFTEVLKLPSAAVPFVIGTELVGGAALLAGLFTRVAAALSAVLMIGAAVTVHLPNGFFMNWFGNQAGEGYEYHILFLLLALALVREGSGPWSLDRVLSRGGE